MRALPLVAASFLLFFTRLAVGQTTISGIDDLSGWTSCDTCSGAGGTGLATPHWQAQFQSTPSMDGNSSQFFLGGTNPYASALWWEQLGPQDSATKFTYKVSYYLTDSTAPQALEFDVNQTVNGYKYVFGTECDFRGPYAGQWRLYDATAHWVPSGIPCKGTAANVWHNLIWQFSRTAGGHTHFMAVTLDGVYYPVDIYHTPKVATGTHELNVAFQMDGNKYMTNYSVWLDQVSLTYQ